MIKKLYKFPLINIFIVLIITLIFGYGISKIEVENDMTEMLPKKNKVYLDDKKIEEIYGGSEVVFIGIKSNQGNILTVENLQTIDNITQELENIQLPDEFFKSKPSNKEEEKLDENYDDLLKDIEDTAMIEDDSSENYDDLMAEMENDLDNMNELEDSPEKVTKEVIDNVQSITNIDIIEGIEGGLEPVSMEDIVPTNKNELKYFKEKLLSWDMYENVFYSKDFGASSIVVTYKENVDDDMKKYVYEEIIRITDSQGNYDLEYYTAGKPLMAAIITKSISRDLMILIPIVTLVLLLVLLFSFKSIKNVFLPLISVLIGTIWTIGLMGFIGVKFTIISVIIPVLLIAIGSAYGIHIITHYLQDKKNKKIDTNEDNKEIILTTMKQVILPVFLAALTTCFGFISLVFMKIISIREFGIFVSVGVAFEFIISIYFIPSVMILLKPKKEKIKQTKENSSSFLENFFLKLARFLKK